MGGGGGRAGKGDGILALGGSGSAGGTSGNVTLSLDAASRITTSGTGAIGVHVGAIGGSGGDGGGSGGILSLGGSGGSGGGGARVTIVTDGDIATTGDLATGLYALSLGGGGGSAHSTKGITPIGGSSGGGGTGGPMTIKNGGVITTKGDGADAVLAQSIGATVAASGISFISANVAVGGSGGAGGTSGAVSVDWSDGITTTGHNAPAVLAQAIGGGGGSSGTTVAGALSAQFSAAVASGGGGGSGGTGGNVSETLGGDVATAGDISPGLSAQ